MRDAVIDRNRSEGEIVWRFVRRLFELATEDTSEHEFAIALCGVLREMTASRDLEIWLNSRGRWVRYGCRHGSPAPSVVPTRVQRPPRSDGTFETLRIPSPIGPNPLGVLILRGSDGRDPAVPWRVARRDLAGALGRTLENRKAWRAQRERLKELGCLYALVRIFAVPSQDMEMTLQAVADELPAAWQYPESAVARIVLDGRTYASRGFRRGRQRQSARLRIQGKERGFVEVCYVGRKPPADEGPFLREERKLLDSIAAHVGLELERRNAAKVGRELEERLRHADRLATLGQLASAVAHELNEPLGSILGFAELARKAEGVPPGALRDLERIAAASLHAREVIRNLLGLVRREPGASRPIDLREIVRNALALLEARAASANVQVLFSPGPALPLIEADPGRMLQLVINLAVNAIQAMPDGGKLTVLIRSEPRGIVLSLRDTGTGMTKDVLRRIFTPFFTTRGASLGTGLGLSIVKEIVMACGGKIAVRSSPGRGSTFEISLPAKERKYSHGP